MNDEAYRPVVSLGYAAAHLEKVWLNGHLWSVEPDLGSGRTVLLRRTVRVGGNKPHSRVVQIKRSESVRVRLG